MDPGVQEQGICNGCIRWTFNVASPAVPQLCCVMQGSFCMHGVGHWLKASEAESV
jgi:hypothetical protein